MLALAYMSTVNLPKDPLPCGFDAEHESQRGRLGSRLYAYGEPAEGSFTLGPMQSTSHSLEDWSRVGSAKGAQRGLTRADAANLTMVSIFERHTTPPSPRAVSRQRGSTPRGDHLSDLLSSSLHLGLRDPEHGTREATCARASLLVLSSSFDLGLRGYLGSGLEPLLRRLE